MQGCCHAQARQIQIGKNSSPLFLKCLLRGVSLGEEGEFENAPPGLTVGWWVTSGKGSTPQFPSALNLQWHWATRWWWAVLRMAGDLSVPAGLWLGWERKTRPFPSPPPWGAEGQLRGGGLPSLCSDLCDALLVPSSSLPSCAVQQGQVSILSGFGGLSEMHQKKHSLWKVVWSSHKERFIACLSSSWVGVAVWTFSFPLSPFWHLTVQLLPGAWEPRGW